jgi:small acid-soluble spore protein E (minor gamma-type SASP)
MDKLTTTEVIPMAKNPKKSKAGTNVQEVKQQNQLAQQGQYEEEYAEETDAQQVRKQNQKSKQNKK